MSKIFSSLIPTTYPVSISSMQLSPKEEVLLVNQLLAQTGEYKFPFILQVVYDNNGWREYAAIFGKTKEGLFLAEPGHKSTENTRRYNYFHVMPFIGMDEDIPDMRKDVAYCSCEKNLTDVKNFVEFMVSGKHRAQIGLLKVFGKSTLSKKKIGLKGGLLIMSLDKAIQDSFDAHFDLERRRKLNSQLAQRLKGTVGIDGNTPHRRTRRLDAQLNAEQLKELLVMYQIPNNESFWHNPATDIVHFITSEEYSKGAQFFFQYCLTMKIPFNENQLTAFTKEFVTAFRNLSL